MEENELNEEEFIVAVSDEPSVYEENEEEVE